MSQEHRVLRMSYLAAGIGGVGFFILSVLTLGVWPGAVLQDEIDRMAPEQTLSLSASELRGRLIYAREGCAYCHTQQIRHTEADIARFGAPVIAWETQLDYPHLWGTRRIGPDLARESGVRSEDWQLAHLYEPRAAVPDSVMPAYPYLFNGAADQPTQAGRDLIAYIETLGRARELAGTEGEARAREACDCPADMEAMEFDTPLNNNPAKTREQTLNDASVPQLTVDGAVATGGEIYQSECSGCHGAGGQGDGPGAAGLRPPPANLGQHQYALEDLALTLWDGVQGTAMPGWRDHSIEELSAVAAFVQDLSNEAAPVDVPAELLSAGAEVYAARCSQCHGDTGAGDGSAANSFDIAPTNFQTQRPSLAASLGALRQGIPGTRMARWEGELTDAELTAVATYVREFYRGEASE